MAFSSEAAFELFRRSWEQRRLAHAYLLAGPAGSGKRALAGRIAALVTGQPAGGAPFKHPDIHLAEPESRSRRIVIEQIRELEAELQLKASGAGRKVGVVLEADRLQPQASNAFLKTLEEPPANCLLLLVSSLPEALLDTIRSRCIPVTLQAAPDRAPDAAQARLLEILTAFFRSEGPDGLPRVFNLSREFTQLLREAKQAIQEKNAAELKQEETLYRQTTDGAWLKDREDYYKGVTESRYILERARLVEMLLQWWADVLRRRANAANFDFPACAATTDALARKFSTTRVLEKIARLEQLRENLDRNVQEQLAVETAFLRVFGPAGA
jgi:DNA polymerase-3 subunit delta'